jgi:hypothetical protein
VNWRAEEKRKSKCFTVMVEIGAEKTDHCEGWIWSKYIALDRKELADF